MFHLYKKRNFNALVNDTFGFIKVNGRNYFGNFFLINGGLMLVLMLLVFLISRIFFKGLFTGMGSPQGQAMLRNYFDEDMGLFVGALVIMLIVLLLLSMITASFPVIYLDLTAKGQQPTAKLIIKGIKARLGRIILFGLGSLITFLPIGLLLGMLSGLLVIILIGIPIGFVVMSTLACWSLLALYDNLGDERNFFTAFKNGAGMLFSNFWAHMGTTAIFLVIWFAIQLTFTLLASAASSFFYYITGEFDVTGISIISIVLFILSLGMNYFFTSIFMLAHGMIYYSCKENDEHKTLYSEIDQIGSGIE